MPLAMVGTAAERTPPPVLAPLGAWVVEAEKDTCLVQRSYGTPDRRMTIAFQPVFGHESMDVIVLTPGTGDQRIGDAKLRLDGSGDTIPGHYSSVIVTGKPQRFTRITVPRTLLDQLPGARTLSIAAKPVDVVVRLAGADKALKVFANCQDGLLRSWGVDPATVTPDRQPQPRDVVRYFQPSDYPTEAIRSRIIGRVVAVVQVDVTGKVTACRLTASAGQLLNAGTCRQAMKVPFEPGKDANGRPAPSIYVLPVRWLLP